MKKLLIIMALFTAVNTADAQPETYFLEKALPNLVNGMESHVDGLIESCIYQSILLKNKHPKLDYKRVINKLKDLSINGSSVKIRYQAHLAFLYIKNSELFDDLNLKLDSEPTENFRVISSTIERIAKN